MSNLANLNYPITDPSGTPYTGPTPDNTKISAQFPSLSVLLSPDNTYQIMGQRNTNTWTASYKHTDTSGNQYLELLTIDASGSPLEATIIEQIDVIDPTSNIVSSAVKTYYLYDYDDGEINLVSKYAILYEASNITQVDSTNQVGTDSSGNPVYGPDTDPSGNILYKFTYKFTYKNWIIDAAGNVTEGAPQDFINSDSVTVDGGSIIQVYAGSWYPFDNFLFNNQSSSLNFDMLFQMNNGYYPVIQSIDTLGVKHYFGVSFSNSVAQISPANLEFHELSYYTLDVSGNMLDISGNIVVSETGNNPSGSYLILTADPNGSVAKLNVVDIDGNTVETPVVMYNYSYANISIDDYGVATFSGPVIIQLNTMLIEGSDQQVDTCCIQINNMISDINSSQFNFGTIGDYQELITSVNEYTSNLDAAKINLDIEQVQYLEQYAANIQSMSGLFGQLVIQLNSTSLVDSESICQRIKAALVTIYDGLQNIKSFKLAIGQQNLLKVSQCVLSMSSKLDSLYGSLTPDTGVTINYESNTINPINSSSVGSLFKLQESLWFFAYGLPTISATGSDTSDNNTYYRSWSNSAYWFSADFYSANFDLNSADRNQLNAALSLITNLNNNMGQQVNMVMANPDVQNLQSSLGKFQNLNTSLSAAMNAMIYKLGMSGFVIQLNPNI